MGDMNSREERGISERGKDAGAMPSNQTREIDLSVRPVSRPDGQARAGECLRLDDTPWRRIA